MERKRRMARRVRAPRLVPRPELSPSSPFSSREPRRSGAKGASGRRPCNYGVRGVRTPMNSYMSVIFRAPALVARAHDANDRRHSFRFRALRRLGRPLSLSHRPRSSPRPIAGERERRGEQGPRLREPSLARDAADRRRATAKRAFSSRATATPISSRASWR